MYSINKICLYRWFNFCSNYTNKSLSYCLILFKEIKSVFFIIVLYIVIWGGERET